jgi:hypothetical protein
MYVVIAIAAVVGGVGVCLMAAALVLVSQRGGWEQAMAKPIAANEWPLQRKLMIGGACVALGGFAVAGVLWVIATTP